MHWRLGLAAIAWLAALIGFATGLQRPAPARPLSKPLHASALVRTLNQAQDASRDRPWSWNVTRAITAHRVLLVDVEATRVADAKAIAVRILEPVRTHGYEEILIYVRRAGAGSAPPARRIQWTPDHGFTEMV